MRVLVGAVRGREDLVEGWLEDLERYHKGERAVLGKEHADSARQIEWKVREAYRWGLRDAEQRGRATLPDLAERGVERARGRRVTRILPRPPRPRGPERGGGRFER